MYSQSQISSAIFVLIEPHRPQDPSEGVSQVIEPWSARIQVLQNEHQRVHIAEQNR